jgi:histidinol-phosphate aminotransferase
MKIKVSENIKDLKPYEPGKPIEELQREIGIPLKDIIKLASNENPLGPSPKAMREIRNFAQKVNRYPDGECFYLKKKLAKKLSVTSGNLIIGNGSDEIIDMVVKAFADKGSEVIISDPAFLEYSILSTARGCKVKTIPVKRSFKSGVLAGFEYDIDKILNSISKNTRIIFLGNPDNPTGAYLNKRLLKDFLNKCPKRAIVVIDEAYRELVDKTDYEDAIRYTNKKNVIILRTFSKAYGLAGLRIGYAIADKELIGWLERVRQPFNVNMIAQKAAEAALDDKEFINKVVKLTGKGRRFIVKNLERMGFDVIESPANFILFSYRKLKAADLFLDLLTRGIIIRDMKPYGLKKWARVNVGTTQENRKFIKALEAIKEEWV